MNLSIVIPCYNEAENIPLIIKRLESSFQNLENVEVLLVNNGSTDNSDEIFKKELSGKKKDSFRLVKIDVNQGYGFGILTGLKEATGDILSWTHADLQTDPFDVVKAYREFLNKNNKNVLFKGKRKNRRALEWFFTWGMQMVAWLALGVYLDDINAQPKLFTRDFYMKYIRENAPLDFSLDLYTLYQARQFCDEIVELPVYFEKRRFGEAKGGGSWKTRIKLIRRTLSYIFELRNKMNKVTKNNI